MSTQELSIPRWKASQLAPGFFKESFYLRNKPVIITDLANDWPAVGKWTPEFLCNTYPDTKATGLTWDGTGVDAFLHYTRLTTNLKEWGDIILRPTGERRAYLTFPVFQAVPELAKDIRPLDSYMGLPSNYPKALRRRAKKPPSLWFGGAGQISPMHFDMSQNFLVQIYGTKKMVLFSPDQSEYVYWPCDQDEPFSYHNVNWTPVDAFNPDYALHPLFKKARGIEITLEPGDILYLPVRWWHFTQSVTDSLSVNFFWQTHWTMLRNADLVWPTFRRMAKARLAAG